MFFSPLCFPLQPNRLKQFGFSAIASEEKAPPEKPRVAFQTPVPASSTSPVHEDFHRGLASTLGETAASRCFPILVLHFKVVVKHGPAPGTGRTVSVDGKLKNAGGNCKADIQTWFGTSQGGWVSWEAALQG